MWKFMYKNAVNDIQFIFLSFRSPVVLDLRGIFGKNVAIMSPKGRNQYGKYQKALCTLRNLYELFSIKAVPTRSLSRQCVK